MKYIFDKIYSIFVEILATVNDDNEFISSSINKISRNHLQQIKSHL